MRPTLTQLALTILFGLGGLGLAGCQVSGPGADRSSAANPITGQEIAVTSLDAPAAPGASVAASGAVGAPPRAGAADAAASRPKSGPASGPAALAAGGPAPKAAPGAATPQASPGAAPDAAAAPGEDLAAEPAPDVPEIAKSPAQLTCEKRGGLWSITGGGAAAFCQSPTRDAGKTCRRAQDCSGYCLEKSRTCAPVTPMLGCHDILNEDGRMLTQCIN